MLRLGCGSEEQGSTSSPQKDLEPLGGKGSGTLQKMGIPMRRPALQEMGTPSVAWISQQGGGPDGGALLPGTSYVSDAGILAPGTRIFS